MRTKQRIGNLGRVGYVHENTGCGWNEPVFGQRAVIAQPATSRSTPNVFYGDLSASGIESLFDLVGQKLARNFQEGLRVAVLERSLVTLSDRLLNLENLGADHRAIIVPIQSFDQIQGVELLKPFQVVVRSHEGAFLATFFDVNVGMTGDTPEEAVANLKDVLASVFRKLASLGEDKLGVEPRRQLSVLREFLKRRE